MKRAFIHGAVHTMDRERSVVEAVLVSDGLIEAVGTSEEILAKAGGAEVVELGGKTVIPGFYDSHMHLLSYGYSRVFMAYLDDCRSVEELVQTLREFVAKGDYAPGEWVEGRGWNETGWPEGRYPNRHDLDRVCTDKPIVIGRSCSFACVTNTKALEVLGLMEQVPEFEESGRIDLDENGVPTGIFYGEATRVVYSKLTKIGVKNIKRAILAACEDYKTAGITSVETDDFELERAGTWQDILQAYDELDREGALPIRVNLMLWLPNEKVMEEFFATGRKTGEGSDFFRLGNFKLIGDGSLGSRWSALLEPYADAPDSYGATEYSQEQLCRMVRSAYEHGYGVVIDGMGDRGIYTILKAYEPIVKENPGKDLRFGIDHCQITTEGLIEEYARLGIVAGLELVFVKSDIEIAEARVGKHRASLSYNWKRFFDNGVHVTAGSDSPVEDFNPLLGIDGAVNRRDWNDQPPEGWCPEQCLTVDQAMQAFTIGGAYQHFEENKKGTLEVGKLADMAVLSDDIFTMDKNKLKEVKALKTIVGGRIVFDRES